VGGSIHIERRFRHHRQRLDAGIHHSVHLQNAWHKYGGDKFEFSILEIVNGVEQLTNREQYWLDKLDAYRNGYNERPKAERNIGRIYSDETLTKLSATHRRLHMEGLHPNSKLNPAQVTEIKQLIADGTPTRSIADAYDIAISTIHGIAHGAYWADVPGPMLSPEELRQRGHRNLQHAHSKLTFEDIRAIRIRIAAGEPRRYIAKDYNMTPENVWHISRGKTWKNAPGPIQPSTPRA